MVIGFGAPLDVVVGGRKKSYWRDVERVRESQGSRGKPSCGIIN